MQWDPNVWPKTFSQGLYGIFGRLIVSATTEKIRLEYALEMLTWWYGQLFNSKGQKSPTILAATRPGMLLEGWNPEDIVNTKKRYGFSAEDYDSWNFVTQRWLESRGKRFKKRGIYKPKNQFDGFLRFAIGGKYKHRRYEIVRDYFIRAYHKSPAETEEIIANYQANGLSDAVYSTFVEEIKRWRALCRKERAKKGAAAKSAKYLAEKEKLAKGKAEAERMKNRKKSQKND